MSSSLAASALFALILRLAVASSMSADAAQATEAIPESLIARIERLEAELDDCDNRDSIRFELALAYRETGALEGRLQAVDLLEKIRQSYWDDRRYLLELAKTYLASGRRMDGREVLSRLAGLDPRNVEIRLTIADLVIRDKIRYRDTNDLDIAEDSIDESLALDPRNRDALFLKSVCLYLSRWNGEDLMRKSDEARGFTEEIIRKNPVDADARLLNGVHCFNLGRNEDADYWFKQGISLLPPEDAKSFLVPAGLRTRYVGDDILQAGELLIEKYWENLDPTPMTVINEILLRYWHNLVVADIYFGDARAGIRGWNTVPGRAIALFGPPSKSRFEHGRFSGGEGHSRPRFNRSFFLGAFLFKPPSITLDYPTGMSLSFHDPTLQGDWVVDDQSSLVIEETTKHGPPASMPVYPGEISRLFVSHASARADEGLSREGCIVCIPPWDRGKNWWKGSTVTLSVLDSQAREVSEVAHLVNKDDIHEISPGMSVILFGSDFTIDPGVYDLELRIEQDDGRRHGSHRCPLYVERFDTETLQISDLEPAVSRTFIDRGNVLRSPERPYLPDPTATVNAEGELDVAYAIYNLSTDEKGSAWYEVDYIVVPIEYRREYAKLLAGGSDSPDDSLRYGRLGDRLGNVVLSEENRHEVQFFATEVRNLRAGAAVRKLATINITDKPDGIYALRITVRDTVSGASALTEIPIQKVSEARRESMLSAQPR